MKIKLFAVLAFFFLVLIFLLAYPLHADTLFGGSGGGVATPVSVANGGTGQSTVAVGDTLYGSAAGVISRLAKGSDTQVLTLAAGLPTWAAVVSSSGVSSAGVIAHAARNLAPAAGTTDGVSVAASDPNSLGNGGNLTLGAGGAGGAGGGATLTSGGGNFGQGAGSISLTVGASGGGSAGNLTLTTPVGNGAISLTSTHTKVTALSTAGYVTNAATGELGSAVIDRSFCVYNAANLGAATALGRTKIANASTATADSTMTVDIAGAGSGGNNFVAKLCSDGVTCAAGNTFLTCTVSCTAAAGTIAACVASTPAIPAGTTATWSVDTACAGVPGTDPGANICAYFTTP